MFARVVTWEGAHPATLDASVGAIREQVESEGGPPDEGMGRCVPVEMLDVAIQVP